MTCIVVAGLGPVGTAVSEAPFCITVMLRSILTILIRAKT